MKTRALALSLVLIAPMALAHIEMVVRGVHFKAERIDFGLPPARSAKRFGDGIVVGRQSDAWRPGTQYQQEIWQEGVPSQGELLDKRSVRLRAEAKNAEAKGHYAVALDRYQKLRSLEPEDLNFVAGRIELLSTPGIASEKGLPGYLRATRRGKAPSESFGRGLSPLLRAWVEFANASEAADYLSFVERHPGSTRVPAALITAARLLTLKPKGVGDLAQARRAADRLLTDHPYSRFAWEGTGVLARIDFLKGRYAAARARYERQLATATTVEQREVAIQSILACDRPTRQRDLIALDHLRWYDLSQSRDPYEARRHFVGTLERFTAEDAQRFFRRLGQSPRIFSAYVDLRTQLEPNAPDVLALANNVRRTTAGTPYRGHVDGLLARTAFALGKPEATVYAGDALKSPNPDDRALGTFVLGSLDRRAGRLENARAKFAEIVERYPKSYLMGGARENLALVSERLGDLQTALDQYLALGYRQDVAYMTDARMSPAQLQTAIRRHGNDETMRFTLAMRYLRREDWPNAERVLRGLSRERRRKLATQYVSSYDIERDGPIQDPYATLVALRSLDRKVGRAADPETKAKALLAMADYYYRHRCLLLYSGPAWRGGRDYAISFSWNEAVALPEDVQALDRHYAEHETFSQALRRYRRVVRDHPTATVARLAAYRGAVAARRLAHMSPYWREGRRQDPLMAEAVELMAFASTSNDAKLAAKAKKFGKVFEEERRSDRTAFAGERPAAKTWNPAW